MHQHLHQDHPPLQLLKDHSHHLSLLRPVLVKPRQPRLHQGKGQDYHQNHHHGRHQTPQRSQTQRYDTNDVGKNRRDFLVILLLTGRPTEIEIKTQYRKLARMYYSDKHDSESTGMILYQAKENFNNINNSYKYFRSQL